MVEEFFAVNPKKDCPHIEEQVCPNLGIFEELKITDKCYMCENIGENWVCLKCGLVGCSRYKNSDMMRHQEETEHQIALSFSDLSFWCYSCNEYIMADALHALLQMFSKKKFGDVESINVSMEINKAIQQSKDNTDNNE